MPSNVTILEIADIEIYPVVEIPVGILLLFCVHVISLSLSLHVY